jgi:Acyl-coenzyme A:6-aminopenicillanic acid acyl-transferase
MKNLIKGVSVFLLVIIFGLLIIFWGRIQNSYRVFSVLNNLTTYINEGKNHYNFLLSATNSNGKSLDTINAAISFSDSTNFLADVKYKQKHYIVTSKNDETQVYMGPSNLIVSGIGSDSGKFDILKLLGDILKNYPQTSQISELTFLQKVGITGWILVNGTYSQGKKEGEEYNIISVPFDSTEVKLLMSDNKESYHISASFDEKEMYLELTFKDESLDAIIPFTDSTKIITVSRKELNTAIYRGALRTGGLLLSRIELPKTNNVDQSYKNGKLIYKNGNRVLLAKGTHKEIGQIEGALLKNEIREMVDATLYTICWVYTAEKKTWFIDDFRDAYKRLLPFIPKRYEEEMEGMAETSEIPLDEIKLTNVFPALFHCSGFAVFNSASKDGKLYHGRVLDYITDLGFQFLSVVYILKPEGYNAFANVGFAGFIGSVTGMNEKQVSFGEMGGKGEGDWDGMPMAFLMRDGLERANTLDEAIKIFSETSRTCEYYYVIADGKIPDARGLSTTPTLFDIIKPNDFREKLDEPVKDAVVMSAGDRYKNLVKRIKKNHGEIDSDKAIHLMDRPVAMKSNLHNALFAPQSLEFWVANAGLNTPACNEPYTHYNLGELLKQLE